jgi:hypothetical protein
MPDLLATILAKAAMILLEAVVVRVVQQLVAAFIKPPSTSLA